MLSEHDKDSERVAPAPVEEVRADSKNLAAFELQADPPITNTCSLEALLRYHDRSFVQHVYQVVARRNPTHSEMSLTLADLRNGDKTKVEIIESIVASQTKAGEPVVVSGLPSPTLRKLGRLPVIGPVFRILRGVTRLPVMMKDQQRFESYALAQQQRLADFLNEQVMPALHSQKTNGAGELPTTIAADVVDSVMMLSDSVVELAAKQAELSETLSRSQDQLKQISDHSTQVSDQLTAVESAQRQLQSQVELLAREPKQLQSEIATLITQREQSETHFREDLVNLTQAIQALQNQSEGLVKQLEALTKQTSENAASQREFLIQEQRLIVETQKVALNELQTQITETQQRTEETVKSLTEVIYKFETGEAEQS